MNELLKAFLKAQLSEEWTGLAPLEIDAVLETLDALVSEGIIVIGRG
jgi:hypothetical protein